MCALEMHQRHPPPSHPPTLPPPHLPQPPPNLPSIADDSAEAISIAGVDATVVAVGAIAAVAACTLLALALCCCHHRRRRQQKQQATLALSSEQPARPHGELAQSLVQVKPMGRKPAPPPVLAPPPTVVRAQSVGQGPSGTAPTLPAGWETMAAADGSAYYHCQASGETTWERPLGDAEAAGLPAGWEQHLQEDGTPYFYHPATGETRWEPPEVRL